MKKHSGPRAGRRAMDVRRRQVAFGLCAGLHYGQTAEPPGILYQAVEHCARGLFDQPGMADRFEFAVQENAAVREKPWEHLAEAA